MKKNIITSILLSAMVLSTTAAFAANEDAPMLISTAASESETIVGKPLISVDGAAIDLSKSGLSQYMYTKNDNVMVPLRAIAEKMGYKVEWNDTDKTVEVSNDEWKTVLEIGVDSYFGVTKIKDAVGMTAPMSYGAVPEIVEDTTFVPAKMFELMGYTFKSIGQYADFVTAGADNTETDKTDAVQIPNPIVEYDNINEASKVLGFQPITPSYVPQGFKLESTSLISDEILQLVYTDKDGNEICYRTAKGSDDISGDYNTYSIKKETEINKVKISLRGKDKINGAVWNNNGFTYSVSADKALDETEMTKIITELK